jgi:hypothetical protein
MVHNRSGHDSRTKRRPDGPIFSILAIALAALVTGTAAGPAAAGPAYQFSALAFGDSASPIDINDHGVVAFAGFCDGLWPGASWVGRGFVQGYDGIHGVFVTDINNAGDYHGTALRNGVEVPTLWIGGVPHDLSDPANASLAFVPDPGPKWTAVNPWALTVIGEPFIPRGPGGSVAALTNAAGQLVVGFYHGLDYATAFGNMDESYAVLTPVPAPAGLAACAAAPLGCDPGPSRVTPTVRAAPASSWRGTGKAWRCR